MPKKWNIGRSLGKYDRSIEDLLDVTAELMVGEMVKSTTFFKAVDTGNYRSNHAWRKSGDKKRRIYNNTEYAVWLELGTSRMIGRPIMRLGLLNAKNVLRKIGINLS